MAHDEKPGLKQLASDASSHTQVLHPQLNPGHAMACIIHHSSRIDQGKSRTLFYTFTVSPLTALHTLHTYHLSVWHTSVSVLTFHWSPGIGFVYSPSQLTTHAILSFSISHQLSYSTAAKRWLSHSSVYLTFSWVAENKCGRHLLTSSVRWQTGAVHILLVTHARNQQSVERGSAAERETWHPQLCCRWPRLRRQCFAMRTLCARDCLAV